MSTICSKGILFSLKFEGAIAIIELDFEMDFGGGISIAVEVTMINSSPLASFITTNGTSTSQGEANRDKTIHPTSI